MEEKESPVRGSCIFCRIVKGEIPSTIIFEDDILVSFLDIAPAISGHSLIVTKQHFETIAETPDEVIQHIALFAKKLTKAMSFALAAEGFNLLMNNKKVAGQLVPHAHVHVIPRYARDGIDLNWRPRKTLPNMLKECAEKIKRFL
ncbi:HIT domain-containing protein [Candidatus Woesearchaeota archaeon]|nr:HIT domain-containing protein [Candidatus Woesearchaeota archaeon]